MDNHQDLEVKLCSLTEGFLASLPEQWGMIETAWARVRLLGGDTVEIEKMKQQVHSLSGAAGSLGFLQIAQAASELQNTLCRCRAADKSASVEVQLDRVEVPLQTTRYAIYKRQQINLAELVLQRLGSAHESASSMQDERADRLIYMVEDDPLQAEELAAQIGYYGYTVQIFHRLVEFEDAIQRKFPAAILMDISFPEGSMAGIEIAYTLREGFPQLPPVIFISMNEDTSFRLEAVRVGGEAYFTKPVDVDALIDVLDRLVFHPVASPYRILVVDDSHVQATYYSLQLKKVGMEVEIVLDPLQVIDHLISFNPDLVLLDIYLPDFTGMELAGVIRQMEQFISIPIVFLSAETDIEKQMMAMGFGGDDFLTKPIDPRYLTAAVNTRVERYRKLRNLMFQDGLTGLLTHSVIKERLIQEMERSRRQQTLLVFALLDLDLFKTVNDTYGHTTGDRVIKSLAQMLRRRLRASDTIGRYGGEEFAVIFPNTDEAAAHQIMSELCAGFAKIVHHAGDKEFTVTFSAGVAAFSGYANADTFIKMADVALYAAKAAGRNQVVTASKCNVNEMIALPTPAVAAFHPAGLSHAALYQNLVGRAQSVILRFDRKGIITFANAFALDFFGFREGELVGRSITGSIVEPSGSNDADLHTLIAEIGQNPERYASIEKENIRKDGQVVWVAWSNTPLLDDNGKLVEILAIGNDITARKRAEAELNSTISRLSALIRIAQTLMNQQDISAIGAAVTREVIDLFLANHVGISLLNADRTQLVFFGDLLGEGAAYLDPGNQIVLADDRASCQALETGKAQFVPMAMSSPLTMGSHDFLKTYQINNRLIVPLINRGQAIGTMNIDFTQANLTIYPAEIELAETIGGAIAGVMQTSLLINADQRQRQYFEALVNHIPVAVVMVDRQGCIGSWNPAAEKMFGYTSAEALGKNIDTLLASDEYLQEAVGLTQKNLREDGLIQSITHRKRKDGTLVEVELQAVPLFIDNVQSGAMAIYHDISELQKARREAEAANEAKSAFLATMSHEIRTPLNAIIGMTTLLLDTDLTADQKTFSEIIRTSGDALLTIINDILDFSKIEAGKMELEEHPFDLRECLESALDLVGAKAAEKGLDVAYLLESDVPPVIISDSARLRQILLNLLSNALKFTNEGEVVLSVSAEIVHEDGEKRYRLHFTVRDTGIGISPDRMDRLFRSFSQLDASTTRKYGGTGLGLAISKRLAELMGGTMWVESEGIPGKGSIFHFTICANSSSRSIPVFMHRRQPELAGKRVLIVDDNTTNRYILMRQVQSWGMEPQETADPSQALEWIRAGQCYDILLLDMQMPEMDGVTLAAAIQRSSESAADLSIIMLTSLGMKEFDSSGVNFAAYLTKPIKPAALYATLLDVFNARSDSPQPMKEQARAEPKQASAQLGSLRILVAEDHMVNQQVALHLLNRLGYRADIASNGLEVLEALWRQPYDVILMDVQMPEMDGLETTRQVRAGRWMDASQRGTFAFQPYIIAMTANAMQGDRERCLASGMDDYVSKPIRLEELTRAFSKIHCERFTEADGSEVEPGDPESDLAIKEALFHKFRISIGETETAVISSLVHDYLNETPKMLIDLQQATEQGNWEKARRVLHSLKSSSMLFGAVRLAEVCQTLETATSGGRMTIKLEQVHRVEREFEAVEKALKRKLNSFLKESTPQNV